MFVLTENETNAQTWALNQNYPSIAAQHAKTLALALKSALELIQQNAEDTRVIVRPTRDLFGFYLCKCGTPVGCDGTQETIKYLKKSFCYECGSRIDWDGIPVWVWVYGSRLRVDEAQQGREG